MIVWVKLFKSENKLMFIIYKNGYNILLNLISEIKQVEIICFLFIVFFWLTFTKIRKPIFINIISLFTCFVCWLFFNVKVIKKTNIKNVLLIGRALFFLFSNIYFYFFTFLQCKIKILSKLWLKRVWVCITK